jgi:hypothetical protein
MKFLRLKMMCHWVRYKKKHEEKFFLTSFKSMNKGVGSGVGSESGSISQRCGSGDPDPDVHQNQCCGTVTIYYGSGSGSDF